MKISVDKLNSVNLKRQRINRLNDKLSRKDYGVAYTIKDKIKSNKLPNIPEKKLLNEEEVIENMLSEAYRLNQEINEIENFIKNNVTEETLYMFALYRYVDCLTFAEITDKMNIVKRTATKYNRQFLDKYVTDISCK